jgi:hypothetical protein
MDASDNGFCNCRETLIRGDRVARPVFLGGSHDCEYVRRRNRLIKLASKLASDECGEDDPNAWTRIFAREMDRLSAERERSSP